MTVRKCLFVVVVMAANLLMSVHASDLQQRLLQAFALPKQGVAGNYYRLRRIDLASGQVRELEYWQDFPHHRFLRQEQLSDGSSELLLVGQHHGWRERADQRICLTKTEREQALQSLQYHFYYLFVQPELKLDAESERRWRVALPTIEPFHIELDAHGRIAELEFGAGRRGREFDYRQVNGIWWPFQFELSTNGVVTSRAEFSQFEIRAVAAEIDAQDAARSCTPP